MADIEFNGLSNNTSVSFSEEEGAVSISPVTAGNDVSLGIDIGSDGIDVNAGVTGNDVSMTANPDSNPRIIGDHINLAGRDLPDQHPIAAITGLQGALDDLEDYADTAAAGALADAKDYADTAAANVLSATELMIREQADADTERYNNLRIDVNGIYSEVGVIQGDMNTMSTSIRQNAQAITLKANTADVNSQFEVQGGQISSLVTTTNGHTTQISQMAGEIQSLATAIDGADGQAYTELSTRIRQNAAAIAAEATRATNAESDLSTRIQTAEGIIQTLSRTNTILNLLPYVYMSEGARGNPCTIDGVTFTVNSDGSVTATGTATDTVRYFLASTLTSNSVPPVMVDPLQEYFLSGCPANGSDNYYLFARATPAGTTPSGSSGATFIDNGSGVSISSASGFKYIAVEIRIKSGYALPSGGKTFYPMLEVGDTAHAYQSTHQGTYTTLSQIKQTADAITSEVTRATESEASLSSSIQTANAFIQTVSSTVSNLSVGSRNLLLNSATKHISLQGDATATFTDNVNADALVSAWGCSDAIRCRGTGGTTLTIGYLSGVSATNPSVNGGKYVHSVYIRNRHSTKAIIIANNLGNTVTVPASSIQRVVLAGTGNGSNNLLIGFRTASIGDAFDFDYWHPQIEVGNVVSDWSPAPEDIEVRVSTTESTILQQSNKIALVVQEVSGQNVIRAASIVTAINDAGSSVVIDADHLFMSGDSINLTGKNISISSTNFSVSASGQIEAKSGLIAGWKIDGSKIYKDITVTEDNASVTYSPSMYAPGTPTANTRAFYVKRTSGNADTYPFSVRYGGKLEATGADISGKITAEEGTVGGFNITSTYNNQNSAGGGHFFQNTLYTHSGDGTYEYEAGLYGRESSSTSGSTNVAFYVGQINKGATWTAANRTMNFYVRNDGYLYATAGSISGSIIASGINAGNITAGTLSAARIAANSIAVSKLTGTITNGAWEIDLTHGSMTIGNLSAANITSGTLSAARIATHSLAVSKITGTVTNGTWGIDFDNGTMSIGNLSAANITSGILSADRIASRSITAEKIVANSITANEIAAYTITANQIAADAITVGKIKAGEITADRINVGQNQSGSEASARKVEWLSQINQAVSMAISLNQSFRIGNWRAYAESTDYITFYNTGGSTRFITISPNGREVDADPTIADSSSVISFMTFHGSDYGDWALVPNGNTASWKRIS